MAETLEAPATEEGAIPFELDRFELADDERLELSGRWFGIRGRRFMRPSLTLVGEDGEIRLLADLKHKPWAAEDGELWRAAFRCTSDDLSGARWAELTVSPDLTVRLEIPGSAPTSPKKQRKPAPQRAAKSKRPPAEPSPETAALRDQVESLKRELGELRTSFERQLEEARGAAKEASLATEQAQAERDRAVAERDEAANARLDALAERDDAAAEQDRAMAELDHAHELRGLLAAERDAALVARDHAQAERDSAVAAYAQAQSERAEVAESHERLKAEHDETIASRGAALVMRNATIESRRSGRQSLLWTITIVVAMAIVVALIIAIVSH